MQIQTHTHVMYTAALLSLCQQGFRKLWRQAVGSPLVMDGASWHKTAYAQRNTCGT
jgi:hypothetical protein